MRLNFRLTALWRLVPLKSWIKTILIVCGAGIFTCMVGLWLFFAAAFSVGADIAGMSAVCCSGPMRWVATIMERDVIRAILGSMGLPADSPPLGPANPSPQTDFEFEGDLGWHST